MHFKVKGGIFNIQTKFQQKCLNKKLKLKKKYSNKLIKILKI